MRELSRLQTLSKTLDASLLERLAEPNQVALLGKFRGDKYLPEKVVLNSILGNMKTKLTEGSASGYTLLDEMGKELGLVLAEKSNWDSEHFGMNLEKFTLSLFDPYVSVKDRMVLFQRVLQARRARMISTRVNTLDPGTVQALEQLGAILTDVLLTFRFDAGKPVPAIGNLNMEVGEADSSETERLATMAEKVFRIDRFHNDPNLPSSKSDALYGKWVFNSMRGLADAVLVARKQEKIAGFITCKIEQLGKGYRYGVIDLVGVNPSYQGQGVGSRLVCASLEWFKHRAGPVYVGTQAANTEAIRLYEGTSFRHVSSEATLHLWPTDGLE